MCHMEMKNGKRDTMDEIEQPNEERIGTLKEKENYQNLGILETDTIN